MKTTPKYALLQPYTSPLLCSNDYFLWLFWLWKLKSQTFRHTDRPNYAPQWHTEINAQLRNHKPGKCHHFRNICCVIEFSCDAFLVTTSPLPFLALEETQRLLEVAADVHIHLGCFSWMICSYSLASYLEERLWGSLCSLALKFSLSLTNTIFVFISFSQSSFSFLTSIFKWNLTLLLFKFSLLSS